MLGFACRLCFCLVSWLSQEELSLLAIHLLKAAWPGELAAVYSAGHALLPLSASVNGSPSAWLLHPWDASPLAFERFPPGPSSPASALKPAASPGSLVLLSRGWCLEPRIWAEVCSPPPGCCRAQACSGGGVRDMPECTHVCPQTLIVTSLCVQSHASALVVSCILCVTGSWLCGPSFTYSAAGVLTPLATTPGRPPPLPPRLRPRRAPPPSWDKGRAQNQQGGSFGRWVGFKIADGGRVLLCSSACICLLWGKCGRGRKPPSPPILRPSAQSEGLCFPSGHRPHCDPG